MGKALSGEPSCPCDRSYLTNGLAHPYHLDEPTSSVRGVWWMFHFKCRSSLSVGSDMGNITIWLHKIGDLFNRFISLYFGKGDHKKDGCLTLCTQNGQTSIEFWPL